MKQKIHKQLKKYKLSSEEFKVIESQLTMFIDEIGNELSKKELNHLIEEVIHDNDIKVKRKVSKSFIYAIVLVLVAIGSAQCALKWDSYWYPNDNAVIQNYHYNDVYEVKQGAKFTDEEINNKLINDYIVTTRKKRNIEVEVHGFNTEKKGDFTAEVIFAGPTGGQTINVDYRVK